MRLTAVQTGFAHRLAAGDVVRGYGDTVVAEVFGQVNRGQVPAVVGRNGVGKSSLLKALAGQLPLITGEVTWKGRAIQGDAFYSRLGQGIAYTPQEDVVFGELTVADNLLLHLNDLAPQRYAELFEAFPLLHRRLTNVRAHLAAASAGCCHSREQLACSQSSRCLTSQLRACSQRILSR